MNKPKTKASICPGKKHQPGKLRTLVWKQLLSFPTACQPASASPGRLEREQDRKWASWPNAKSLGGQSAHPNSWPCLCENLEWVIDFSGFSSKWNPLLGMFLDGTLEIFGIFTTIPFLRIFLRIRLDFQLGIFNTSRLRSPRSYRLNSQVLASRNDASLWERVSRWCFILFSFLRWFYFLGLILFFSKKACFVIFVMFFLLRF